MVVAAFSPDSKGFYVAGEARRKLTAGSKIIMLVRYAVLAATALAVAGLAEAQAQSPFPPAGAELQQPRQSSPFPPAGQASPFPSPNQQSLGGFGSPQPQQMPPCIQQFITLRQDLEKRMETVKNTMSRKPTATEACNVLTKFTQAEANLIKYVTKETGTCPFPGGLLDSIKASNAKSEGYKQKACTAAAQASRPRSAEPTLSDAFGAPSVNKDTTRTGRGTLDSLSGNPIAR